LHGHRWIAANTPLLAIAKDSHRFVRAQDAAINGKGGDAMINTQVQEKRV